MDWILIVILWGADSSPAMYSVNFRTEAACHAAAYYIEKKATEINDKAEKDRTIVPFPGNIRFCVKNPKGA